MLHVSTFFDLNPDWLALLRLNLNIVLVPLTLTIDMTNSFMRATS